MNGIRDWWNGIKATVPDYINHPLDHVSEIATILLALTVLAGLAYWSIKIRRGLPKAIRKELAAEQAKSTGRRLVGMMTVLAATLAMIASSTGSWNVFSKALDSHGLPLICTFAVFEIAMAVFTLNARYNMRVHGKAGFDGVMVWILACVSGVLSATEAHDITGVLARISISLVAAGLLERDMIVIRWAARKAKDEQVKKAKRWQVLVDRFYARFGIATDATFSATEYQIQRWITKLSQAAYNHRRLTKKVDALKAGSEPGWWLNFKLARAEDKFDKVIFAASGLLEVTTDPVLVRKFRTHLSAMFAMRNGSTEDKLRNLSAWDSDLTPDLPQLPGKPERTERGRNGHGTGSAFRLPLHPEGNGNGPEDSSGNGTDGNPETEDGTTAALAACRSNKERCVFAIKKLPDSAGAKEVMAWLLVQGYDVDKSTAYLAVIKAKEARAAATATAAAPA